MNKIEQLIAKLCPNGVEFKSLGEVCEILDNQRIPIAKDKRKKGIYPYYGANGIQDYIDDYIFEGNFVLLGEDGSVIKEDNTPIVNWASGKIWVNNHAHVLQTKDGVILRYFYYCIQTVDASPFVAGTPPKINQANLKQIKIPIPPLEIQEEIVKILDNFSELTAELTARKKQYEYYRNTLLDFGDENHPKDGIEFKRLGEITEKASSIKWKDNFQSYQYIDLSSVDLDSCNIVETTLVNATNAPSRAKQIIKENDILFGTTRPLLRRYAFVDKEYDNQLCSTGYCVLRVNSKKILPKWIYYIISTDRFLSYVSEWQEGTSYPSITDQNVKNYKIPIPPLETQQRIVNILDRFEALTSDYQEGLPAEIEARTKQYEYYRDKLLDFKELESENV